MAGEAEGDLERGARAGRGGRVVVVLRLQPRGQQPLELRCRAAPRHAQELPVAHLQRGTNVQRVQYIITTTITDITIIASMYFLLLKKCIL